VRAIRLERDGPLTALVIDRAERRNALSHAMLDELVTLAADVAADPAIRVLVVRSATAGIFCAGGDIAEYRDHADDLEWSRSSQRAMAAALAAVRSLPIPTVAAIDGPCMGGGCALAVACDLRACTERAEFAIPVVKLGAMFPIADAVALTRLIGPARAKRMLLTGARIDAATALRYGLVDELCAVEGLDGVLAELTGQLCAAAPRSARALKLVVELAGEHPGVDADALEHLVLAALAGPEYREGIDAFVQRRAPVFADPA